VVSSAATGGRSVPLLRAVLSSTHFFADVIRMLSWLPAALLAPLLVSPSALVASLLVRAERERSSPKGVLIPLLSAVAFKPSLPGP